MIEYRRCNPPFRPLFPGRTKGGSEEGKTLLSERIFIGVAWPYANGPLHLGHLAGCYLSADIFARYHRAKGNEVLMVSGSDSHGTPITVRAEAEGVTPEDILNRYHPQFLDSWNKLGITFDLFTTTHTENHQEIVHTLFKDFLEKGYLYEQSMLLAYCAGTILQLPMEGVDGQLQYHTFNIAQYLHLPPVPGANELAIFAATIIGAGVGFLWFNAFPAQVFMGDVGSLALGGAIGTLAVLTKNEFLSVIICGLFVVEALSVIIQTTSYKLTGKRVFRMAPIHHHFELKGWPEPRVIVRFWIITVVLVLAALATLKLR